MPPSQAQKRAATAVALILLALFFGVLPFIKVQLPKIDAFIPVVAIVMFLADSITAALLFVQFSVLRSRALLVLANGYLFTSLIVISFALTFPGAFAPNGLLGAGMQSAPWLFSIWHIGLPATIIGYTLLNSTSVDMRIVHSSARSVILLSLTGSIVAVCALTWLVIATDAFSPTLMLNQFYAAGGFVTVITSVVMSLCAIALVLLWFRQRSVLDLWLLVVSLAWLLDSILFNLIQTRYSVGWYANRAFAILAASFVLFVLLTESTMLYARLALSVLAQRREREGRLMSMDAMTAAIAHEVKQPLGAIVTNANAGLRWLDRMPPDLGEVRDTLKHIAADGHRASEVIQSVRALFAKSDKSGAPVNVNELVRESIALVQGDLETAGITVRLELSERLPLVTAHQGQLQQVILNLVRNALDAMLPVSKGRRILEVQTEHLKMNGVSVRVADSGIGIETKDSDRIFDAFFTTKPYGMGMGLAICRSILEAHGGSLSVSPNVPHGSIFQVLLPESAEIGMQRS